MAPSYSEMAARLSISDPKFKDWKTSQLQAFVKWEQATNNRLLLFYPTGEGKTTCALAMMVARGFTEILVITPPKPAINWKQAAKALGVTVLTMSVNMFRDKKTKIKRGMPIIVDEFHMMGKHNAVGFTKLRRMAGNFSATILCSATPNYNDAERCYNVSMIMDPEHTTGDFIKWIYENCETVVNPFAITPDVVGFHRYDSAAGFLAKQPYTAYLEDTASWISFDLEIQSNVPPEKLRWFDEYGYYDRKHKMLASDMEARWARNRLVLLTEEEKLLRPEIAAQLIEYMNKQVLPRKFLLFSVDKVIAKATRQSLHNDSKYMTSLITGDPTDVEREKQIFINIDMPAVLVGTAALATGVDEIDTVSNHLINFVDTNDDTMRRQLIGRVLPRGTLKRDTIVTTVSYQTSD